MYTYQKARPSSINSIETMEGETIENKIERLMSNKEPITDGAPLIYTERKEGTVAAYNIRTDRWEIATEAMDKVHKQTAAKREGMVKTKDREPLKKDEEKGKISEAKSIPGTDGKEGKSDS